MHLDMTAAPLQCRSAMGLPSCFTGKTKVSLEVADLDALSFKLLADALHKGQSLGAVAVDAQGVALDSDFLTGHSMRHTAATLNLLNGGTVEETRQLLGHTNINTTLIYSHALERAKNNSEERIAKAIFG